METGRWRKEPVQERICMVCVTGKVESEAHFLLDCYIYHGLRQIMFQVIKEKTGYSIGEGQHSTEWQVDFLLGQGLKNRKARKMIAIAVSSFVAAAWRMRRRELKDSRQVQVEV
jgi:hypothetical protein